jgi:DNA-binding CsgD family transcriptional regulator
MQVVEHAFAMHAIANAVKCNHKFFGTSFSAYEGSAPVPERSNSPIAQPLIIAGSPQSKAHGCGRGRPPSGFLLSQFLLFVGLANSAFGLLLSAAMQKPSQNGNGATARRGASLLSNNAWSEIARTLNLTRRELQIVQSVFDNLPERGIARSLRISEHTVHTHLNRLFKKLTVTTRTDLVLRIMEQMMLRPPPVAAVTPAPVPEPARQRGFLRNPPARAIQP